MIIKANAKLNWTLNLLGERADGYHELDMLMQSVDLCDELELEDADEFSLTIVGGAEVSAGEDNLVLRAARLLAHECGVRTGANIRLVKRIPARAGLGGGSSDAAAVLHALNAHWRAGVGLDELCALGMRLGADIPYCLTGGLCRVQGLGEQVSRMDGAPEVNVVIAMPDAGREYRRSVRAEHALRRHRSTRARGGSAARTRLELAQASHGQRPATAGRAPAARHSEVSGAYV